MQYLLTQQELDNIKFPSEELQRNLELAVETLQKVCTYAAINIRMGDPMRTIPSAHGCVLWEADSRAVHCESCDGCPVIVFCPYDKKI